MKRHMVEQSSLETNQYILHAANTPGIQEYQHFDGTFTMLEVI
jgi:hypothetical protein